MKHKFPIMFFCFFFSTSSYAQEEPTTSSNREIMLWGGTTYPYLPSESRDYWKNGWNAGLGYGIFFSPGSFGYGAVNLTVEYNRFPFNESGYTNVLLKQYEDPVVYQNERKIIQTGTLIARGTLKYLTAMLNFKGSFSATKRSIAPYFLIGVGYVYLSSDNIAFFETNQFTVKEERQSAFAWSVGVGVEVPFSDAIALFAQGKSVLGVFDRTRQYFPVSGGIRITI